MVPLGMIGGDRRDVGSNGDRCVVWHPRGVVPDGELLTALARRGMTVLCCDNRCEAFARVCTLGAQRAPAPAGDASRTILLLSDPERLRGVAEVVALAERYAPRAICGVFKSAGDRGIRAVTPEDTERWARAVQPGAAPIVTLARHLAARTAAGSAVRTRSPDDAGAAGAASLAAAISGPRLRLTGEGQLPPAPEPEGTDDLGRLGPSGRAAPSENQVPGGEKAGAPPSLLITDQELAMLLAKDPLPGQD